MENEGKEQKVEDQRKDGKERLNGNNKVREEMLRKKGEEEK